MDNHNTLVDDDTNAFYGAFIASNVYHVGK